MRSATSGSEMVPAPPGRRVPPVQWACGAATASAPVSTAARRADCRTPASLLDPARPVTTGFRHGVLERHARHPGPPPARQRPGPEWQRAAGHLRRAGREPPQGRQVQEEDPGLRPDLPLPARRGAARHRGNPQPDGRAQQRPRLPALPPGARAQRAGLPAPAAPERGPGLLGLHPRPGPRARHRAARARPHPSPTQRRLCCSEKPSRGRSR